MAKVLGIGVGLFLLAFIWVLALFVCVAFSRAQGGLANAGIGSILFAIVLTLILWFFPRSGDDASDDSTVYDDYVRGREALVSLIGITVLVGLILMVLFHLFDVRRGTPLRKLKAS